MSRQHSSSSIPIAWLKPVPEGYQIPLWRWVLVPATVLMLKRNGGVWISGTLSLTDGELHFLQSKAIKTKSTPLEEWTVPLGEITDLTVAPGFASETLRITHSGGTHQLMTARSDDFVAGLRKALAGRGTN